MSNSCDYRCFKILFVDSDVRTCESLTKIFAEDFDILTAHSAEEAWRLLEQYGDKVAVLVSDNQMPDQQGGDLLSRVHLEFPAIVRILTTACSDLPFAVAAVNIGGVFRYLTKPWDLDELKGSLLRAIEFFLMRRERDQLLQEKLQVLHRLTALDRVRALSVFAAALRCRLRNPLSAWNAYIRQAPLDQWRDINMGDALQIDPATVARTETENLLALAHDVLWATLPWGVETWHEHLDSFHDEVDVEQIVCQVGERLRMEGGRNPISLHVDTVPPLPKIKANSDLLCRLFEILIDRVQSIRGIDSAVMVHLAVLETESACAQIQLRLISEGPAWSPAQVSDLFSAVAPATDWMKRIDKDLLPAFFLAHHHSGTIHIDSHGWPGPSLEVVIATNPEQLPDEVVEADWLDGLFSRPKYWPDRAQY